MASRKTNVTVQVLADTKKFSKAFRDLNKTTGFKGIGDKFKRLGSRIGDMVRTGVRSIGLLMTAIAGLAIKGGFERMMKIEDAQAKLKGLGHEAKEVDQIMSDALESVKGTAYGLDTAATTAATAVAAGIGPGKELEEYLRLVADAATIAGIDMGEMGGIMNKVEANGKAMTENLNQLQDRGIPVLGWLADEYGVTTAEMSKMVSQGEVDSDTFKKVLQENIGGAAKASGDTTRGAFKNMLAALSRTGESVLTHVFPMFKDAFGGITEWLDGLTDKLKPLGEAFSLWLKDTAVPAARDLASNIKEKVVPVIKQLAEWVKDTLIPAIKQMIEWIRDTLIPALKNMGEWVVKNKDWLMTIAVALGAAVAAFKVFMYITRVIAAVKAAAVAFKALSIAMAANPIGIIIVAIAALVAGLVYFFTQTETGKKIWEAVWGAIKDAVAAVVDWWQNTAWPAIETVWNFIVEAAQAAAAWYQEHLAPVFEAVGELLSAVFERVGAIVVWLWEKVIEPYFTFMVNLWTKIWEGVKAVWEKIGPPIMTAIETAINVMKTVWETVWNVVKTVVEVVWKNIRNAIETALGVIKKVIEAVTKVIKGDWSGAWESIKGAVSRAWEGIKTGVTNSINAVRDVVKKVITGIRDILSNILDGIKKLWKNAWENTRTTVSNIFEKIKKSVRDKINNVKNTVKGIPDTIKNIFKNAGNWLKNAGKNIIDGLINGIKNGFNKVKDTLSGLTDLLPSWKGPPAKDRTILRGAGNMIIEGLSRGMREEFGTVKDDLTSLTKTISGTDMGELSTPRVSLDLVAAQGARGGGNTYEVNIHSLNSGPEVGRMVVNAIKDFERVNGRTA